MAVFNQLFSMQIHSKESIFRFILSISLASEGYVTILINFIDRKQLLPF